MSRLQIKVDRCSVRPRANNRTPTSRTETTTQNTVRMRADRGSVSRDPHSIHPMRLYARFMRRLAAIALLAAVGASCGSSADGTTTTIRPENTTTVSEISTTNPASTLQVSSPSFEAGERIPTEFTCDGDDVSPELRITGIPDGSEVLALVVDDPDAPAGTWDHWVEYDIPVEGPELIIEEDAGQIGVLGTNSWDEMGYGGPCPPSGEPHRYFFRVWALDGALSLREGADSETLRSAMDGHVLAQADLMGTYGR